MSDSDLFLILLAVAVFLFQFAVFDDIEALSNGKCIAFVIGFFLALGVFMSVIFKNVLMLLGVF